MKQVRCGKCKKVFPKGLGHNARTCVRTVQHKSGAKHNTVSPHAQNLIVSNTTLNLSPPKSVKKLQRKQEKENPSVKPQRTVDKRGTVRWKLDGKLHRLDGPAVEFLNGSKKWYIHGKPHRNDGPAIERANGNKEWCQHGKRHRDDGPAVEWVDGTKEWYRDGVLHRDDGPAVEYSNGTKIWYVYGERHRDDGPAVESLDGYQAWYKHDKFHRLDGPAVEEKNGDKEWWVGNVQTGFPELCEKAVSPGLNREEFYALCTHKDYVIRQLVAHNPKCPTEWRVLVELMKR